MDCVYTKEEGTRDFFAFKTTDNVTKRLLAGDRIIELERPVDSALSDLVLDHTHGKLLTECNFNLKHRRGCHANVQAFFI